MSYRPRPSPTSEPLDISSRRLRALTLFALIGYPLGSVLDLYPGAFPAIGQAVGTFLHAASLVTMFVVAASSLAQLVSARRGQRFDEFQLSLRHAALAKAYIALSTILSAAAVYVHIGSDFGVPLPASRDAWQQLSLYFVLLILVLPTTFLVWSPTIALAESDEGGE